MRKILLGILMFISPILGVAQSLPVVPTYQVATITSVKPHEAQAVSNSDEALYEVSVKVRGIVYVVLTPSPSPAGTISYAVGREVLVHIEGSSILWNDIMGLSHEAPIISRSLMPEASTPQGQGSQSF